MIDVDDLDAALLLMVDKFEPPDLSLGQQVSLAVAVIRACGLVLPPPVPTAELRLRGQRHTIRVTGAPSATTTTSATTSSRCSSIAR